MAIVKRTYTIDNSDVLVQAVTNAAGQLYGVHLGTFGRKGEVVLGGRDLLDFIAVLEGIAKDHHLYEQQDQDPTRIEVVNTSAARMPMLEELAKQSTTEG